MQLQSFTQPRTSTGSSSLNNLLILETSERLLSGTFKLTYKEMSTLLTQVEACLNSRPLVPLPSDDVGIEALTPGHFLIERPLHDDSFMYANSISSLATVSSPVPSFLEAMVYGVHNPHWKYMKWHHPSRNITVGDIVILRDDSPLPTKWSSDPTWKDQ